MPLLDLFAVCPSVTVVTLRAFRELIMATPRTPNQKKRYKALNKRLAKYVSLVQNTYDSLALDAANIVITATDYSPETDKPFRFKDYPQTKARIDELMRFFSLDLNAIIYTGTSEEWKQSNLVQDLLANDVLRAYRVKHKDEKYKKYYQTNNDALKAFRARKDKGKTVSQKIWNQSYNFKREMEYAISSAIEKGQSAVTLSKRISKYLHDFPSLCDDYKERYGEAVDCKDCEYRSIRLARSEINMAYRVAEQTRWEQMDFIKGYEIKLSHSHPKRDVCDLLIGIYPKWFKWTGWHPNDLCYVVPIVMSDTEWYSGKGREIKDMPRNFKYWIYDNTERIEKAKQNGTLPYWIKDNFDSVSSSLKSRMALRNSDVLGYHEIGIRESAFVINNVLDIGNKLSLLPKGTVVTFDNTLNNGTIMEWRNGVLAISTAKYSVPEGYFCPSENLLSAFQKLKNKDTLTFNEEYAIESLFHESIHSKAKFIDKIEKYSLDEAIMESCTQLYARERYIKILNHYGVEAVNHDDIRKYGYGYDRNCNLLRRVFTKDDVLQLGELINIANGSDNGYKALTRVLIKRFKFEQDDIDKLMSLISLPEL